MGPDHLILSVVDGRVVCTAPLAGGQELGYGGWLLSLCMRSLHCRDSFAFVPSPQGVGARLECVLLVGERGGLPRAARERVPCGHLGLCWRFLGRLSVC